MGVVRPAGTAAGASALVPLVTGTLCERVPEEAGTRVGPAEGGAGVRAAVPACRRRCRNASDTFADCCRGLARKDPWLSPN